MALLWRTERLNKFIDKIAFKYSFIWKIVFTIGAFLAIGELCYIIIFLSYNLIKPWLGKSVTPVLPLIPGVTIGFESIPYFLISALIVFCLHELAHGISARVEGIKVKSIGLMVLIIIVGGFAELDDEDINRAKLSSKLRLLAAGSMANILCGILVAIIIMNFPLILSPLFNNSQGVLILDVLPNSPAHNVGMRTGDVILAINGVRIHDTVNFIKFMHNTPANSTLLVTTLSRSYVVKCSFHPLNKSIAFLGVRTFNYYPPKIVIPFLTYMFPWYLFNFLSWLEVLSISAALINMLPIAIFDGNRFFESIFQASFFRSKKFLIFNHELSIGDIMLSTLRFIAISLLLLNISFSFYLGKLRL